MYTKISPFDEAMPPMKKRKGSGSLPLPETVRKIMDMQNQNPIDIDMDKIKKKIEAHVNIGNIPGKEENHKTEDRKPESQTGLCF